MKTYTQKELNDILKLHNKWINEEIGGVRANLSWADLEDANLSGANLSRADLRGANLRSANLRCIDLSRADLSGVNLSHTNLIGANLSGANLINSNLRYINLFDNITNFWVQTTLTPISFENKNTNPKTGKVFKVKKTGKIGLILPYQVFKGWNRGFLDGKIVEFEMGEWVKVLKTNSFNRLKSQEKSYKKSQGAQKIKK